MPTPAALKVVAKVAPVPVAPRVLAKVEPVAEAPRPATPVVKSAGSHPKSDWLVLLPADEAATEGAARPAVAAPAVAAAPAKPRTYSKAERDYKLRAYNDYVMKASSDPYSNLK
jgi:septal ring-binding cell division protein DamX